MILLKKILTTNMWLNKPTYRNGGKKKDVEGARGQPVAQQVKPLCL